MSSFATKRVPGRNLVPRVSHLKPPGNEAGITKQIQIFFRDAFGLCIFSEMVLRTRQQMITSCLHSRRDKRAGLVNLSSTRIEAVVLTVATQHVVLGPKNTQF